MNIDIFSDYEVKTTHENNVRVAFDEFEKHVWEATVTCNGGVLMDRIAKELSEMYIMEVAADSNPLGDVVRFETFNPMTGEGGTTVYVIKRVMKELDNEEEQVSRRM